MYKLEKTVYLEYPNEAWEPCLNYSKVPIEYHELSDAIKRVKHYSDLRRWIKPIKVIDEGGLIYCVYDPERDTRLPGCRWRRIQRDAYDLSNSGLSGSAEDFWHQATLNLEDSDGIFVFDEPLSEYIWNKHFDQG